MTTEEVAAVLAALSVVAILVKFFSAVVKTIVTLEHRACELELSIAILRTQFASLELQCERDRTQLLSLRRLMEDDDD